MTTISKITFLISLILFQMLLFTCSENNITNPNSQPSLSITEREIIGLSNDFGISLFKEINKSELIDNIFISPLSVSLALAMAYNGADGTTEEAMRAALKYGDLLQQDINNSFRHITDMLTGLDSRIEILIGNSIWLREKFNAFVSENFLDINRTYFDAEVTSLDFTDPQSVSTINNWVNSKTNGKIPKIIENISDKIVMFLINAIYFKGDWTNQFKSENTVDGDFFLIDGTNKLTKMMSQKFTFEYMKGNNFQVVNLPYGEQAFSMTIILPNENENINNFISQLDNNQLQQWIDGIQESNVALSMPKFKLEYDKNLNDVLKILGMEIAFFPNQADFSNIIPRENLFIDEVLHSTFINVNEEGTEAAAATSVGVGITSDPNFVELRINRPYIFLIREKSSNTILFIGKIIDPAPA